MDRGNNVPDSDQDLSIYCDRCGKGLLIDSNVRYEVTIEVKAAYDPLELTDDDLSGDLQEQIDETIDELKQCSEEEAMDEVYRKMEFNLCSSCQSKLLESPLPDKQE